MKKYATLVLLFSLLSSIGSASYVIPPLGVTTAKIAANAVTRAKLQAVGQQSSSSSGSFTTTSTSFVDVTNLSVSITTTGRPVIVMVIDDGANTSQSLIGCQTAFGVAAITASCIFTIIRDAAGTPVSIYTSSLQISGASSTVIGIFQPVNIIYMDVPSAGAHTYKVGAETGGANMVASLKLARLVAYEL